MRDFAAAKTQRDLALVAFREEAANVAQLDVVVAVIGTGTEFDFLDLDDRLLGLGFSGALLFLVLELAVVHQPANRRIGSSGDFHQVNVQLARHAQCFHDGNNAEGLVFWAGQTHFRRHDFTVEAVLALLTVTAIAKFSSYGFHP
ncbi:hypothetical protein D3C71_1727360 [compost metagenome]